MLITPLRVTLPILYFRWRGYLLPDLTFRYIINYKNEKNMKNEKAQYPFPD